MMLDYYPGSHLNSLQYTRKTEYLKSKFLLNNLAELSQSKKISNYQELIQSDPISCPQNQKGNN